MAGCGRFQFRIDLAVVTPLIRIISRMKKLIVKLKKPLVKKLMFVTSWILMVVPLLALGLKTVWPLVLHPLLVLLVLSAAIQQGFRVEPFTLVVVVLVAALPSASNVALLTERFGADTGRIAKIILLSTAAAFFTFSGAVALLIAD